MTDAEIERFVDAFLVGDVERAMSPEFEGLAYEQSQRGALLLNDGETGGASHRSRNGEREASAQA